MNMAQERILFLRLLKCVFTLSYQTRLITSRSFFLIAPSQLVGGIQHPVPPKRCRPNHRPDVHRVAVEIHLTLDTTSCILRKVINLQDRENTLVDEWTTRHPSRVETMYSSSFPLTTISYLVKGRNMRSVNHRNKWLATGCWSFRCQRHMS